MWTQKSYSIESQPIQSSFLDRNCHLISAQLRSGEPPRAAGAQGQLILRGLAPAAQRAPRLAAAPPRGHWLRDAPGVDAEHVAAAGAPTACLSRRHCQVHQRIGRLPCCPCCQKRRCAQPRAYAVPPRAPLFPALRCCRGWTARSAGQCWSCNGGSSGRQPRLS